MPLQTLEAVTDEMGNLQFTDSLRLPAHSKVYVIIPEQTVSFNEIAPGINNSILPTVNFPMVRVEDEGLAKRLVKIIVEEAHA